MNANANTNKKNNCYTQAQRHFAKMLFILWMIASGSLACTLATTTSPDPISAPYEAASYWENLGHSYEKSGNYTEALNHYQQALQVRQALHTEDNQAAVATALHNVGVAYERLGNYTEALRYYQQALEMKQALHQGESHAAVAKAFFAVGVAYENLGKYRKALEGYEQASTMLQILCEGKPDAALAKVILAIGVAYEGLGNYTQALEHYQQALEKYQALHPGGNHADVANALLAVGFAYYYLGQLGAVIQNWEGALSVPAVSQATKANVCHDLGCMYHVVALQAKQDGNEQEGQAYLGKATANFEQAIQDSGAIKAGLYTTYGNFLLATGTTAQAHHYLQQAIECGDDASKLSYSRLEQPTVTPVLQAYISQQQQVQLRAIHYAYYLMILHYEDFQKAGITMPQNKEEYLAAYQASLDQCRGLPGQAQAYKTAYHLLGSLYEAQGNHEAAAALEKTVGKRKRPRQ